MTCQQAQSHLDDMWQPNTRSQPMWPVLRWYRPWLQWSQCFMSRRAGGDWPITVTLGGNSYEQNLWEENQEVHTKMQMSFASKSKMSSYCYYTKMIRWERESQLPVLVMPCDIILCVCLLSADTRWGVEAGQGMKSRDVGWLSNSSVLLKWKSFPFSVTLRSWRVISSHKQAPFVRYIIIPKLWPGRILLKLYYLVVNRI